MLSWGNKNITVEIPISGGGGGGGGNININPEQDNTEYQLQGITYKGQPIYYQWFSGTRRIATSPAGLIGDINTLLFHTLTFQGISNGNPTGVKWLLPYTYTNGTGVILQLNGGSIQVQSQNSNFQGNYQISGLLIYTK